MQQEKELPEFVKGHRTVRTEIREDSFDNFSREWVERPIESANLITSETLDGFHRPILDIDFEAALVPSSTPGHYHLYLDKVMNWSNYKLLLEALYHCGIIQPGFYDGALRHEATSARLPWIDKYRPGDNQMEPPLEEQVAALKEKVKILENAIALLR